MKKVSLLFRAAVRYRPVFQRVMTSISRQPERIVIPWTAVRAQPLQHLEVPAVRRRRARLVPRAAVRVRPLQHLEVSEICRARGRFFVPREVIRAQPLKYFELSPPAANLHKLLRMSSRSPR